MTKNKNAITQTTNAELSTLNLTSKNESASLASNVDDTKSSEVSQDVKNESSSEEEKILTEQQELLLPEPPVSVSSPDVEGNVETVETATKSEVETVVKTEDTIAKAKANTEKAKTEAKKRTKRQKSEEAQAKKEADSNRIEDFGNLNDPPKMVYCSTNRMGK